MTAGQPVPATVLDPFGGSGTTALVADRLGRDAILVDLNADYVALAERRLAEERTLIVEEETSSAGARILRPAQGRLGL